MSSKVDKVGEIGNQMEVLQRKVDGVHDLALNIRDRYSSVMGSPGASVGEDSAEKSPTTASLSTELETINSKLSGAIGILRQVLEECQL